MLFRSVNVSRSNANSGSEISAADGTNYNALNNQNWYFTQTISGVVYASDETTPILTGPTVRIKINGAGTGAAYSTTASGSDGSYSLTVPVRAGETISLYLDTNGGITGATVTVAPSADVSSVAIVQNALSTRCDNSCSLTNTNIDYYDKGNDSDIHATVTTGALTVDNDWKTIVKANTFAPGGAVTSKGGFVVKAGAEYSEIGRASCRERV